MKAIQRTLLLTILGVGLLENPVAADEKWTELTREAIQHYQAGDYAEATKRTEASLRYARENFGDKHPDTLVSMSYLAFLYRSQGRYEQAEPLQVKALNLQREVLGDKHPYTLISMSYLALLYREQGRYDEAEPLLVDTLALRREVLGDKDPATLTTMGNLAALYKVQGRYEQAEPLMLETLALRRQVLGERHPATLTSMNDLALLYRDQGRYDEAESLYVDVLALSREVRGEKHPDTLGSMHSLAVLYHSQGRYDQAESLFVNVVALKRQVLGEKHPSTLKSMNSLAVLYQSQGRYDQAEPLLVDVLALRRQVLGEEHRDTLISMNNLAELNRTLGRYDQAEPLHAEALALNRQVLGEKHPNTLNSMNNLAGVYFNQGRYNQAELLLVDLLALRREVLGEKHPDTLNSMNNLALLYMTKDRFDQAEPFYVDVLALSREVLGDKHPITLASAYGLASLYRWQGRHDKAEALLTETLALFREVLGDKHPRSLVGMSELGALYRDLGRFDEAEPLLADTLALRRQILGDEHPDTISNTAILAALYFETFQYGRAEQLVDEALVSTRKFLNNMLWGAGEATRSSYMARTQGHANLYLTILAHRLSFENAERALLLSLSRKGLLLQIATQIRAVSRSTQDPRLRELAESLENQRRMLSHLVLSGEGRNKQINQLEEEINRKQAELSRKVQQLGRSAKTVTPEQVIQALDRGSAFIDFLVYRPPVLSTHFKDGEPVQPKTPQPQLLGLLVAKGMDPPIRLIPLGDLSPIQHRIERYREIVGWPETLSDEDIKVGQFLYASLITPFFPYIENRNQLYIAPDGVLNLLPFASLIDHQRRYLVERYTLTMISSGRDLVLQDLEAREATEPTIVAAPLYDPGQAEQYAAAVADQGQDGSLAERSATLMARSFEDMYFSPLPGTLKEGEALKDQFQKKGESAELLKLGVATEDAVSSVQSPRILHLATHAYFVEDIPNPKADETLRRSSGTPAPFTGVSPLLRSGLGLADANLSIETGIDKQPGILTAEEVLDLELAGTDLVVLSACETALGDIEIGEGVYGLRRAFQEAGAKAVLSTLWEIADEGTHVLMDDFYQRFLDGTSPQQALRETQLWAIQSERWRHPFFWAPFVMVGRE